MIDLVTARLAVSTLTPDRGWCGSIAKPADPLVMRGVALGPLAPCMALDVGPGWAVADVADHVLVSLEVAV